MAIRPWRRRITAYTAKLREVRRRLKAEGRHSIDENALFAGYERLRQIEAQVIDTTQNRRRAQRRDHHRQREPLQSASNSQFKTF